jgi:large subunit ribosomal protein L15
MRLHDLRPAPGSNKDRKRLGRGNASGQGTTAGKGTKGQKARAGGLKAGFRGMSSRNQRMAKRRGFTNIFKTTFQVINVDKLSRFESGAEVTPVTLAAAGLIDNEHAPVKILGNGDLAIAVHVAGLALSQGARQKIEAAGGSVISAVTEVPEEDTGVTGGA